VEVNSRALAYLLTIRGRCTCRMSLCMRVSWSLVRGIGPRVRCAPRCTLVDAARSPMLCRPHSINISIFHTSGVHTLLEFARIVSACADLSPRLAAASRPLSAAMSRSPGAPHPGDDLETHHDTGKHMQMNSSAESARSTSAARPVMSIDSRMLAALTPGDLRALEAADVRLDVCDPAAELSANTFAILDHLHEFELRFGQEGRSAHLTDRWLSALRMPSTRAPTQRHHSESVPSAVPHPPLYVAAS
jgi:hypothetical protein